MPGSATSYPKKGQRSGVKSSGHIPKTSNERLASRFMLAQSIGPVPAERRVLNDYAKNPRTSELSTNPRKPIKGQPSRVTQNGVGTLGNVMHTRYPLRNL